ncbi:MAG TPA: CoA transferase [Dehalococcoidia bacterium]|nr:CoA transferase [Dehalococcoidia bacterium]
MAGPFEGLTIVEFGRFIAVPYCAQLFADGGADVIKVEPIIGDETRRNGQIIEGEGRQYLNKNRGKRSLAVDLNDEAARDAVKALVHRADIVLANFRPGLAEGFGLDYDSVAAVNPRVIYAENTGYGHAGPLADAPGIDITLQAYSGIAQFHPDDGPIRQPNPLTDYGTALIMAWGVSTALYHRERSGRGQKLDTSLLQAALVLQNNHLNHIDAIDSGRSEFAEYLKTAFADGASWSDVLEARAEAQAAVPMNAYYGFHRTSDGTIALGGGSVAIRRQIVKLLEIEDRWVTEPGWMPDDARAHATAMVEQMSTTLAAHTTEHWLAAFRGIGVPVAPVQMTEQVIEDEQVLANGYVVRLEHELLGGYTVTAPPVQFSETALSAENGSPVLGKHTRELLGEAGLDNAAINALIEAGAAREPSA